MEFKVVVYLGPYKGEEYSRTFDTLIALKEGCLALSEEYECNILVDFDEMTIWVGNQYWI